MDPLACWRNGVNGHDLEERPFHALNLLKWFAMGGFIPADMPSLSTVVDRCETIIIKALEAE